jgi:mannose-6-phosphate isomerase-like protein (cupin superfamily)
MRYVFNSLDTVTYRFPTHTNELLYGREEAATTETFVVVLEPGEAPPLHKHPDCEQVFYMTEGSGLLQIGAGDDARKFRVKPGDLVRVPPDTLHRVHNDGQVPMRYISVDAFVGAKPIDEPTWDSHAKAQCDANGWAFESVKRAKRA